MGYALTLCVLDMRLRDRRGLLVIVIHSFDGSKWVDTVEDDAHDARKMTDIYPHSHSTRHINEACV